MQLATVTLESNFFGLRLSKQFRAIGKYSKSQYFPVKTGPVFVWIVQKLLLIDLRECHNESPQTV